VDTAALLRVLEESAAEADVRPALALLAGQDLAIDERELNGARRRALLLLAAGGDPHRALDLDGRTVTALAVELDAPERRETVRQGLLALEPAGLGLGHVAGALGELLADADLAWRAYAAALLAEELDEGE
jgi:hypothetical protein